MKKLPPGFESPLFALLLSGAMSLLVTSMALVRNIGWVDGLLGMCIESWPPAWGVAFFSILIIAPIVRKVVRWCVELKT